MDDYGLDVARASFLEDMGRYADAAELHFAEGHTFEAIRLLTLDRANEASMRRAFQYLLDGLWRHLSCGLSLAEESLRSDGTLVKLFNLLDTLQGVAADVGVRDEVR